MDDAARRKWLDSLVVGSDVHSRDQGYESIGVIAKVTWRNETHIVIEVPRRVPLRGRLMRNAPMYLTYSAETGIQDFGRSPVSLSCRIEPADDDARARVRAAAIAAKLGKMSAAAWEMKGPEVLDVVAKAIGLEG